MAIVGQSSMFYGLTRQPPGRCIVVACLAALVLIAGPAVGGVWRHNVNEQQHIDLAAQPQYSATGVFTAIDSLGGYLCSGTLIHPEWVLTAAHCIDGESITDLTVEWNATWSGTIGAGIPAVQWIPHPDWEGNNFGFDIGLVRLAEPVTDITPAVLYEGDDERGHVATIVGYGRGGVGTDGDTLAAGTKRAGHNMIDAFGGDTTSTGNPAPPFANITWSQFPDTVMLIDFDDPDDSKKSLMGSTSPLALEYMITSGDSGGGWYIDVEGVTFLAGVTSFGTVDTKYGAYGGAVRASQFHEWIMTTIPEPAAAGLLLGLLPLLLRHRRRESLPSGG